ncbi:precorrin-3B synthase [Amycolatopsis sp. 195334CR]|uniref:precorrin-3B synthase n=1 Tax=Amycolatopsis sp. 195334CR TaxID=2814588 RepID=UPI001A8CB64F|nr:precorrin-3B synthase [Amycolatopsis sp. 195334CR]MBN6037959.1 precorrin-3B synthase [Amycolatopsis sp. 195334CR]
MSRADDSTSTTSFTVTNVEIRQRADACPGVFATHDAADGALARVRLPGGRVTAAQLRELAACAADLGDGELHLTSRGNLQLRGLRRNDPRLAERLAAAGLLPAFSHERVRNYLASPEPEVDDLVTALDRAVCAEPDLAALPGRFLFAIDSGRGDVAGERADVTWCGGAFLIDGEDTGVRITRARAVEALVAAALAFVASRGEAWRLRESAVARDAVLAAVRPLGTVVEPERPVLTGPPAVDGRVVAPWFGCLTGAQAGVLAALAPSVVVTPWRSIVLPEARPSLAGAGFFVDPSTPGVALSACIGSPGCAKSHADVRAEARRVAAALPVSLRAHFSGCDRRCGRPRGDHVDVVATGDGGRSVDGQRFSSVDEWREGRV